MGTGKIGKVFCKIMKGFGANVIAYDVYEDKEAESQIGFKYVTLDTLLAKSDIISIHCPLTKENEDIINDYPYDYILDLYIASEVDRTCKKIVFNFRFLILFSILIIFCLISFSFLFMYLSNSI